jgi:hypothetical protein
LRAFGPRAARASLDTAPPRSISFIARFLAKIRLSLFRSAL